MSMNKYLTVRGEKRERGESESPENSPVTKKGCDIKNDELLRSIETTIEKLLDRKLKELATKEDVSGITKTLNTLTLENDLLKKDVQRLKAENIRVLNRLDRYEDRSRRNNLIFRGMKFNSNEDCREKVKDFCENVLKCDKQVHVNRAHILGKKRDNAPIIAHIPQDHDINSIMDKTKNLKGTGFVVHKDYSRATRVQRNRLYLLKKEIMKSDSVRSSTLKGDQLVIDGQYFTWREEEGLRCGGECGVEKLNNILKIDCSEMVKNIKKKDEKSNIESNEQFNE
ncbi:uncharacterized protein LOC120351331 [Nilaparvata lugens]|uniref:uncharacterized protein LOC120351331 n=1 Tax=Nilaparvata lugens TaxID=108931 RepID=UPI00193D6F6D|nr:uncharacterized protein LOC120351331 [Nilaparvata lugens]